MKRLSYWQHWICKDCETLNHNSRTYCLSCEKHRKLVQITDQKRLDKLYFKMNGKGFRKLKEFKDV